MGKIKILLPDNKGKKGHPARDHRIIVEAILWVLRTGAPWRDIPQEFFRGLQLIHVSDDGQNKEYGRLYGNI